MRRAASTIGIQFARVRDLASENFTVTLLVLLGLLFLFVMMSGSRHRR